MQGQSRANYAARACDVCRRRKLKCDGNLPCKRCSMGGVSCLYSRHERTRSHAHELDAKRLRAQITCMQEQLNDLGSIIRKAKDVNGPTDSPSSTEQARVSSIETAVPRISTNNSQKPSCETQTFRGPTSNEHAFKIARGSLDLASSSENPIVPVLKSNSDITTGLSSEALADRRPSIMLVLGDPLWTWNTFEVQRLIGIFMEGPGSIYPVLESNQLFRTHETLLTLFDTASRAVYQTGSAFDPEDLASTEAITLKLVLANASAIQSCGIDNQVRQVFDSIRIWLGRSFWGLPSLHKIINWLLVALLHLHIDEELQASRIVALAARQCFELGINRGDLIHREGQPDPALSLKVMWSILVLDRRLSITLGLPFVIDDCDVHLTTPGQDEDSTYLIALASLSRIAGTAYRLASKLGDQNQEVGLEKSDYLDFQILQLQKNLPQALKQRGLSQKFALVLHLNQVRNLIHRPILFTRQGVAAHPSRAATAVEVARETLRFLLMLDVKAGILQAYPLSFKQFLLSALSILVLAIANGADTFGTVESSKPSSVSLRQELYETMSLFKTLASRSVALQRLWESVQFLEALFPRTRTSSGRSITGPNGTDMEAGLRIPGADCTSSSHPCATDPSANDLNLELFLTDGMNMQLSSELSSMLGVIGSDFCPDSGFFGTSFDGHAQNVSAFSGGI